MQSGIIIALVLIVVILIIGYLVKFGYLKSQKGSTPDNDLLANLNTISSQLASLKEDVNNNLNNRLDNNQKLMLDSITRQFSESSRLVQDVTKTLTELKESNKKVVNVTDELKTLQNILQNPKQRGVLGEYYLKTVLANVLPPDGFKLQYHIGSDSLGHELICDAVVFLNNNLVLPIDSKFSLENYNRLVNEKDPLRRQELDKQLRNDLKRRIDETAKYIQPQLKTMDFAFMFIPSEAIYYDLLSNQIGVGTGNERNLIDYAFIDNKVIIVSPTSFLAYLQTVLQGLNSLHIEKQAQDIQLRVVELGRHLNKYQELMIKLGNSLSTSVGHYNNASQELAKVDKDVIKITKNKDIISSDQLISLNKPDNLLDD